jgi:hypothetical protein
MWGGGDGDLAGEALGAEGGGELGAEDLEGDPAVVLQVLGEVDGGHAALAELPLDAVALGEGGLEAGHRVGHVELGMTGMLQDAGARAAGLVRHTPLWPNPCTRPHIPPSPKTRQ